MNETEQSDETRQPSLGQLGEKGPKGVGGTVGRDHVRRNALHLHASPFFYSTLH